MDADPLVDRVTPMSPYEAQVWRILNEHWQGRDNRRGLPNWASIALNRTGEAAVEAATWVTDVVPEIVKEPIRRAGDAVAGTAMRHAFKSVLALLDVANDWAMELNDPTGVEKLARKRGFEISSFTELQQQDLKVCGESCSHL